MSADFGLRVDRGHRSGTSPARSEVEKRAERAEAVDADQDLAPWGVEEWVLPGQGDEGPGCGEWYPKAVCETCGEPEFSTRRCGNRSCPTCWGMWSKETGVRATQRIQAFRETQPDNHRRQAAHAIVSPPDGEVMNERQYWKGRKRAAEIAERKGFRGAAVVPHPYRPTDEAKQRYRAADPEYGIWVWLRKDKDHIERWVRWSPHYHVIGMTTADMEPGKESDEWLYRFERSLEKYNGKHDRESHDGVYGTFRYLLSHTGYPAESSKQTVVWYGDLANNVFVDDATKEWQIQKPSEGVMSVLRREIEAVAGATAEADGDGAESDESDDVGECTVKGCDGLLIDVFDVGAYLRQANPPPEVEESMKRARDWRLGRVEPPPGLKRPQTAEQVRESWDALAE